MDAANIIESISIIIAAWAVILGITAWRREFIGKRNLELAEDILALFYEARDAINGIRSPFAFAGEGSTRKAPPNEDPIDKEVYDKAFVTRERYIKRSDLFNKIYSMRYRYMARFGRDTIKPFDELQAVIVEILSAADTITYYWRDQAYGVFVDEDKRKSNQENIRTYEKIIWKMRPEDDTITPRLDKLVSDIEIQTRKILAPSIKEKFKFPFNKPKEKSQQKSDQNDIRKKAGTLAALAAALLGTLPVLIQANIILFYVTIASVGVLFLSSLILLFHDKLSSPLWKWLVARANGMEVEYAAAGIGLVSTGLSLIQPQWLWVGIIMLLVGAYLIGSQIGKGINMMIEDKKVKQI